MKVKPIIIVFIILASLFSSACNPSERPEIFKPTLPIAITYRPGISGYVFTFTNESTRTLVLKIFVASSKETNQRFITLAPGKAEELSWFDGFPVHKGDALGVYHPDYKKRFSIVE